MGNFYFFSACFLSFLTIHYAVEPANSGCLEREKALASLEIAEGLLTKAKAAFPSCMDDFNSSNQSECGKTKALAYVEISKKLISDVRRNFPKCPKAIIVVENKPKDCSEILASGRNESGVYTIWPRKTLTIGKPLQVYCDMDTDEGGWTMIQRRGKFPVQQDFYKDWESYKNGFGNITQEFWLGNENIHVLCYEECQIRFDLQDKDGEKAFALYQSFKLSSNYCIDIGNYSGNANDGMVYKSNRDFSTKDQGNLELVQKYKGGWWYEGDSYSNPNGIYQPGANAVDSVKWFRWRGNNNLAGVEIKVKAK